MISYSAISEREFSQYVSKFKVLGREIAKLTFRELFRAMYRINRVPKY